MQVARDDLPNGVKMTSPSWLAGWAGFFATPNDAPD